MFEFSGEEPSHVVREVRECIIRVPAPRSVCHVRFTRSLFASAVIIVSFAGFSASTFLAGMEASQCSRRASCGRPPADLEPEVPFGGRLAAVGRARIAVNPTRTAQPLPSRSARNENLGSSRPFGPSIPTERNTPRPSMNREDRSREPPGAGPPAQERASRRSSGHSCESTWRLLGTAAESSATAHERRSPCAPRASQASHWWSLARLPPAG
jgi:hypothetical protein